MMVNIRKFTGVQFRSLDELVARDMLTAQAAQFLRACVQARLSIVFAGPPGSGKTTLLSCCAAELDPSLRVVVAEEVFEADVPLAERRIDADPARPVRARRRRPPPARRRVPPHGARRRHRRRGPRPRGAARCCSRCPRASRASRRSTPARPARRSPASASSASSPTRRRSSPCRRSTRSCPRRSTSSCTAPAPTARAPGHRDRLRRGPRRRPRRHRSSPSPRCSPGRGHDAPLAWTGNLPVRAARALREAGPTTTGPARRRPVGRPRGRDAARGGAGSRTPLSRCCRGARRRRRPPPLDRRPRPAALLGPDGRRAPARRALRRLAGAGRARRRRPVGVPRRHGRALRRRCRCVAFAIFGGVAARRGRRHVRRHVPAGVLPPPAGRAAWPGPRRRGPG